MKKIMILPLAILFSSGLYAQGVYNNGGKIVIGSGAFFNISGTGGNFRNETSGSNGSVILNGTLKLAGNLTNNVAATDLFSTSGAGSEVMLAGTTSQTIGGTTTATSTFNNLTLNNPAGIILAINARVNGTMTFTSGVADIGNINLTFGLLSAIAGLPSSASMIIATGTGQVLKEWSAAGNFTFPVGDKSTTAKYSPVTLNFGTGTFAAGATAGVNVVSAKYSDPAITGSYINRYWNISQTGITAFTANAVFQYDAADVTGTESSLYCLRVNPLPISPFDPVNIGSHQLTATGLTSFGSFTGGLGLKTLNLSLFIEGLYNGTRQMRQAQGSAGNQYTGTTADQLSVELHSAAAGQYSTVVYSASNVNLSTTGVAAVSVPASVTGNYYVTIKHRNTLATVSATALSFASGTVNYDFSTSAAMAFGGRLKNIGGVYVLYGGDVNQDGIIDLTDMTLVDNLSAVASGGYISGDVTGDGLVDMSDMISIDNNSSQAIGTITP